MVAHHVTPVKAEAKPPRMKETVRFIVTNTLSIHENNTIVAIKLMSDAGIAMTDIETADIVLSREVRVYFLCSYTILVESSCLATTNIPGLPGL